VQEFSKIMSDQEKITLTLTVPEVERFCKEVMQGSANAARKHATLVALEGFVARHAGADSHTPCFNAIQARIRAFAEETRKELLAHSARELAAALERADRHALGRIHSSLSRNGFSQVLNAALEPLDNIQRFKILAWLRAWKAQAETAAREASGYPDAMNFKGAGVDLKEYTAISDIERLMG